MVIGNSDRRQVKTACAAKARIELEWKDAQGACGRIATALVDGPQGLSPEQSEDLNNKLDLVRRLSEKLKKDLDSHLLTHGCAVACYQQIAKLLDEVAEKHNLLAQLFDTLPDPKYAERDEASAQSERLLADECARIALLIRSRVKPLSQRATLFRSLSAFLRNWLSLPFVPRFIRNFAGRVLS